MSHKRKRHHVVLFIYFQRWTEGEQNLRRPVAMENFQVMKGTFPEGSSVWKISDILCYLRYFTFNQLEVVQSSTAVAQALRLMH